MFRAHYITTPYTPTCNSVSSPFTSCNGSDDDDDAEYEDSIHYDSVTRSTTKRTKSETPMTTMTTITGNRDKSKDKQGKGSVADKHSHDARQIVTFYH
jgi:hypothetical protein